MVQELLNGKAHAMVSSSPEPAQLAVKYAETLFLIDGALGWRTDFNGSRKGDPDTLAYLNNWIMVVRNTGLSRKRLITGGGVWIGVLDPIIHPYRIYADALSTCVAPEFKLHLCEVRKKLKTNRLDIPHRHHCGSNDRLFCVSYKCRSELQVGLGKNSAVSVPL